MLIHHAVILVMTYSFIAKLKKIMTKHLPKFQFQFIQLFQPVTRFPVNKTYFSLIAISKGRGQVKEYKDKRENEKESFA